MIHPTEIAWATGLLEGEGFFCMSGRSIAIVISMTDRDVIERIARLLAGHMYGPLTYDRSGRRKPVWRCQLKGPRAAGWMMMMYSWLGSRRRAQVGRALWKWRQLRPCRLSPEIERSIIAAWKSGETRKLRLARRFGVSRETVYRVLGDHEPGHSVRESSSCRVTPVDVAWLAGLVEGEGNISFNGRSLTVRIKMTDRDVISRAATLLGGKIYLGLHGNGRLPTWQTQVKGSIAAGWVMTLYPWLGARRRRQVVEALAKWKIQVHGTIPPSLGNAIVSYRAAGFSQADIIRLLKVSKSTVYRQTRGRVRRMRVMSPSRLLLPTDA